MNWRKKSIKGFKVKPPKHLPAMPVRHSTNPQSLVPMWLLTLLVVFALFAGSFTAFHLATTDVYASCATKGEWTWSSFMMKPAKPIKCSVDESMKK
jgi:hypothetical protein